MTKEITSSSDTIVAIATPPGKGGVGIIRISGSQSLAIAQAITGKSAKPRAAHFAKFSSVQGEIIDSGLLIYFAAPRSFTGEDVVELQGHGGPVVQDLLLQAIIEQGARQARPGEFSERAFINDKIDLTQAEAIADLINSRTKQAAQGAMRSLQGEFSNKIKALLADLIQLRMYVEAAIDFPEEEIDFLADKKVQDNIEQLITRFEKTIEQAGQGAILKNGIQVVLAGKPNVGKSSLLNALAGNEAAIVTEVPGTTRDIVSQSIDMDGLVVDIIDTAGLRDSDDAVEKIGIKRARKAIQQADHILLLHDAADAKPTDPDLLIDDLQVPQSKITVVNNKIDLTDVVASSEQGVINISAKYGQGIEKLKNHIKQVVGFSASPETLFTARRRHVNALQRAFDSLKTGLHQLQKNRAGELLAEELLQAQQALNEITGEFSADDLLGEIFSGFCIGK